MLIILPDEYTNVHFPFIVKRYRKRLNQYTRTQKQLVLSTSAFAVHEKATAIYV